MSELNGDCSDTQAEIIKSPSECIYSMTKINSTDNLLEFKGNVFNSSFPKGCFIEEMESGANVYWNHHSFGSKNSNARQMCSQDGKNQKLNFVF